MGSSHVVPPSIVLPPGSRRAVSRNSLNHKLGVRPGILLVGHVPAKGHPFTRICRLAHRSSVPRMRRH